MESSSNEIYLSRVYLNKNPNWHVEDSSWKAQLIYALARRNKIPVNNIIDVGCGSGGILRELGIKDNNIQSLKGYDISPHAITLAKEFENERISFYNEDFLMTKISTTDLLLVIDVIEHIDDFYQFLRRLRFRSSHFIFHIPLDLSLRALIKPHILLDQRKSVGHIHYFSKEMICWIFKDTGYQIIDWHYTKPVIDIVPPGSFKAAMKKSVRNFSFFFNKAMSAKLWGLFHFNTGKIA